LVTSTPEDVSVSVLLPEPPDVPEIPPVVLDAVWVAVKVFVGAEV